MVKKALHAEAILTRAEQRRQAARRRRAEREREAAADFQAAELVVAIDGEIDFTRFGIEQPPRRPRWSRRGKRRDLLDAIHRLMPPPDERKD